MSQGREIKKLQCWCVKFKNLNINVSYEAKLNAHLDTNTCLPSERVPQTCKQESTGLPAELFTDEVVVGLKRLCADSCVDFGQHPVLILDSGVQHCGSEDVHD